MKKINQIFGKTLIVLAVMAISLVFSQSAKAYECVAPKPIGSYVNPYTGVVELRWIGETAVENYIIEIRNKGASCDGPSSDLAMAPIVVKGSVNFYTIPDWQLKCGNYQICIKAECCNDSCEKCQTVVGTKENYCEKMASIYFTNKCACSDPDFPSGIRGTFNLKCVDKNGKVDIKQNQANCGPDMKPIGCDWKCGNMTGGPSRQCAVDYDVQCAQGPHKTLVNGYPTWNLCSVKDSRGYNMNDAYVVRPPGVATSTPITEYDWKCYGQQEKCLACQRAVCNPKFLNQRYYSEGSLDRVPREELCKDANGVITGVVDPITFGWNETAKRFEWDCIGNDKCTKPGDLENKNYIKSLSGDWYQAEKCTTARGDCGWADGQKVTHETWRVNGDLMSESVAASVDVNFKWPAGNEFYCQNGGRVVPNSINSGSLGFGFKNLFHFQNNTSSNYDGLKWRCEYDTAGGKKEYAECSASLIDCGQTRTGKIGTEKANITEGYFTSLTSGLQGTLNKFCQNGANYTMSSSEGRAEVTSLSSYKYSEDGKYQWFCFDQFYDLGYGSGKSSLPLECSANAVECVMPSNGFVANRNDLTSPYCTAGIVGPWGGGFGGMPIAGVLPDTIVDSAGATHYQWSCIGDFGPALDRVDCDVKLLACEATVNKQAYKNWAGFTAATRAVGGDCSAPKSAGAGKEDAVCTGVCTRNDAGFDTLVTLDTSTGQWSWDCGEEKCESLLSDCAQPPKNGYFSNPTDFSEQLGQKCINITATGADCCGVCTEQDDSCDLDDTKKVHVTFANGQFNWQCKGNDSCIAYEGGCLEPKAITSTTQWKDLVRSNDLCKEPVAGSGSTVRPVFYQESGISSVSIDGFTPYGSTSGYAGRTAFDNYVESRSIGNPIDVTDPINSGSWPRVGYKDGTYMWRCEYSVKDDKTGKVTAYNTPFPAMLTGALPYPYPAENSGYVGATDKDGNQKNNYYCYAYETNPVCGLVNDDTQQKASELREMAKDENDRGLGSIMCDRGVVTKFDANILTQPWPNASATDKYEFKDGIAQNNGKCYWYCETSLVGPAFAVGNETAEGCSAPCAGCSSNTNGKWFSEDDIAVSPYFVDKDGNGKKESVRCSDNSVVPFTFDDVTNLYTWDCFGDKCSANKDECLEPPHKGTFQKSFFESTYVDANDPTMVNGCKVIAGHATDNALAVFTADYVNKKWNWRCHNYDCYANMSCEPKLTASTDNKDVNCIDDNLAQDFVFDIKECIDPVITVTIDGVDMSSDPSVVKEINTDGVGTGKVTVSMSRKDVGDHKIKVTMKCNDECAKGAKDEEVSQTFKIKNPKGMIDGTDEVCSGQNFTLALSTIDCVSNPWACWKVNVLQRLPGAAIDDFILLGDTFASPGSADVTAPVTDVIATTTYKMKYQCPDCTPPEDGAWIESAPWDVTILPSIPLEVSEINAATTTMCKDKMPTDDILSVDATGCSNGRIDYEWTANLAGEAPAPISCTTNTCDAVEYLKGKNAGDYTFSVLVTCSGDKCVTGSTITKSVVVTLSEKSSLTNVRFDKDFYCSFDKEAKVLHDGNCSPVYYGWGINTYSHVDGDLYYHFWDPTHIPSRDRYIGDSVFPPRNTIEELNVVYSYPGDFSGLNKLHADLYCYDSCEGKWMKPRVSVDVIKASKIAGLEWKDKNNCSANDKEFEIIVTTFAPTEKDFDNCKDVQYRWIITDKNGNSTVVSDWSATAKINKDVVAGDVVKVEAKCMDACAVNDNPLLSTEMTMVDSKKVGTPEITGTKCSNDTQELTATITGGDCSDVKYQWYVDDVEQIGETADKFSKTVSANAKVQVKVRCADTCSDPTDIVPSNVIIVKQATTLIKPEITGVNEICKGDGLTLKSSDIGTCENLYYAWLKNGVKESHGNALPIPDYAEADVIASGEYSLYVECLDTPCGPTPSEYTSNSLNVVVVENEEPDAGTLTAEKPVLCRGDGSTTLNAVPGTCSNGAVATYRWLQNVDGAGWEEADNSDPLSTSISTGDITKTTKYRFTTICSIVPCLDQESDGSNIVEVKVSDECACGEADTHTYTKDFWTDQLKVKDWLCKGDPINTPTPVQNANGVWEWVCDYGGTPLDCSANEIKCDDAIVGKKYTDASWDNVKDAQLCKEGSASGWEEATQTVFRNLLINKAWDKTVDAKILANLYDTREWVCAGDGGQADELTCQNKVLSCGPADPTNGTGTKITGLRITPKTADGKYHGSYSYISNQKPLDPNLTNHRCINGAPSLINDASNRGVYTWDCGTDDSGDINTNSTTCMARKDCGWADGYATVFFDQGQGSCWTAENVKNTSLDENMPFWNAIKMPYTGPINSTFWGYVNGGNTGGLGLSNAKSKLNMAPYVQGICPGDFEVPTNENWFGLANLLQNTTCSNDTDYLDRWQCSPAGEASSTLGAGLKNTVGFSGKAGENYWARSISCDISQPNDTPTVFRDNNYRSNGSLNATCFGTLVKGTSNYCQTTPIYWGLDSGANDAKLLQHADCYMGEDPIDGSCYAPTNNEICATETDANFYHQLRCRRSIVPPIIRNPNPTPPKKATPPKSATPPKNVTPPKIVPPKPVVKPPVVDPCVGGVGIGCFGR